MLLLSDLADHSRNIREDNRVSLLVSVPGDEVGDETGDATEDGPQDDNQDDPLARPRLSLVGRAKADTDPNLRARFLARHPRAEDYAGFGDFRIYRLHPVRGRLVAGFGRVAWIEGDCLLYGKECGELREREAVICAHMNADHADAVRHYAANLLGRGAVKKGEPSWLMTGVDPEGCDLRRGDETARLDFAHPVASAEEARAEPVRLAGKTDQ